MKKSVGLVVALFLAGSASLAAAQFRAEGNNLIGSSGWNSETPAQPAIEPVPPMSITSPTAGNVPLNNCDSAGCWGANGTHYTRAGNVLFGSNGRVCNAVAPDAPAMCD